MPDDRTVLYTLLGVLFILLAVVVYNNQRARQEQESGGRPLPSAQAEDVARDDLLLKFARHHGGIVGETVATHEDRLILKQAGVFKSVALAAASVEGDEVVLAGDIDWKDAVAKGEAWHAAHTKGHDPLVTEQLTRSQDVRNPALAALKDRDGPSRGEEE